MGSQHRLGGGAGSRALGAIPPAQMKEKHLGLAAAASSAERGGPAGTCRATLTSGCSFSSAVISVLQDGRFGPGPDGTGTRKLH